MNFSIAFIILLMQHCSWYEPNVPITIMPDIQYETIIENVRPEFKNNTLGFAYWEKGIIELENCKIVLKDIASLEIACHEYKHCAMGLWHG